MADTNEAQLLTDLLGEVAQADAQLSAAHLETRVVQAALGHSGAHRRSSTMYLVIAAIAVLVVLLPAAFRMNTRAPALSSAVEVATTEQPMAATTLPVAPKQPQPAIGRRAVPPSRAATHSPVAQSATTDLPVAETQDAFVPLMPMTEQELSGPFQLVRVQMPRASLGALRLPLEHPNELVEADVLLGEDGMARAIRVSTSGSTNSWRLR